MRSSVKVALTAVFAALHTVLYFASFSLALWRNWAIYMEPVEGILLGPWAGFSAALIGSAVGRMISPDPLWMFGIVAEPLSVLMIAFLAKRRWIPVLAAYGTMLVASLVSFGTHIPLWTILDVLLALVLIYPVARFHRLGVHDDKRFLPISVILISFVGTVTDSLTRIFLFIPVGLYASLGLDFEAALAIFVGSAVASYIEDVIVVLVSFLAIVPLLLAVRRMKEFQYPLT
jgi:hypothetical protein